VIARADHEIKLQADIIAAVASFMVQTGPIGPFGTAAKKLRGWELKR